MRMMPAPTLWLGLVAALLASAAAVAQPSPQAPTADPAWHAPTPVSTGCGNGLIETGESCEQCPVDCEVKPCQPSGTRANYKVTVVPAPAAVPVAVAVRIAYRSDRLQLPSTGVTPAVRERVTAPGPGAQVVPNDMDHSLRIVLADAAGLGNRGTAISFDRCKDAPPPHDDDVLCWIEHCSGSGGAIAGCGCTIDPSE